MSKHALLGLLFTTALALPTGVHADDLEQMTQWYEATHAPEVQAEEACGTVTKTASYPGFQAFDNPNGPPPIETKTFAVTQWTGGCENGKRSGHGIISTREDISDTSGSRRQTTKIIKAEGTYVHGLQQGLWCVLDYQALADGEKDEWDVSKDVGCRLVIGHVWNGVSSESESPHYKRLADGRWQQMDDKNMPVLPEVLLPAGSVEAESERLIAEAKAGNTNVDFKPLTLQTNALDGLIVGTQISEGTPISMGSIKGKRVALVLSSNMLAELERFNSQRQQLLAATATFTGDALVQRNRFEVASKQERLLQMMAAALRRRAGEVTAVDDLSGLAAGKFDFAYVLDWHSLTHMDLLGKFKDFPEYEMGQDQGINYVAGQTLGGFLISPDMKVVSRSSSSGEFEHKIGGCTQTRRDRGCDTQYLEVLAKFYESAWENSDRRTLY